MKIFKLILFFFSLAFLTYGCTTKTKKSLQTINIELNIKNVEVLKNSLVLDGNKGIWYYNNKPYSGYSVKYHKNDTLMERIGFYKGKKQGVAKSWFRNGVLRMESHYEQNKLVGSYKAWWNNKVLALESHYESGKLQGVQKRWHYTGVLAKKRNLEQGKENGMQQAWLKNGKMYVNYEAKNGRIFGMRRANSCYQLENEVVVAKN